MSVRNYESLLRRLRGIGRPMPHINLGNHPPAVSNTKPLVPQPLVIVPVLRRFRLCRQPSIFVGFGQGLEDFRCFAGLPHVTLPTKATRRFDYPAFLLSQDPHRAVQKLSGRTPDRPGGIKDLDAACPRGLPPFHGAPVLGVGRGFFHSAGRVGIKVRGGRGRS
jgi:hypothetical protein